MNRIARLLTFVLLTTSVPLAPATVLAQANAECPKSLTDSPLFRDNWLNVMTAQQRAVTDFEGARKAVVAAMDKVRPADPSDTWAALDVRVATAEETDAAEALKLVSAGAEKTVLEKALAAYEEALKAFKSADAAYQLYAPCANRALGMGPGHVNTVVFVGELSDLAPVEDEPAAGNGEAPPPATHANKRKANFPDLVVQECLQDHKDITELGTSQGHVRNITRAEGMIPYVWDTGGASTRAAASPGAVVDPESAGFGSTQPSPPGFRPLPLTPKLAVMVMSAEYDPVFETRANGVRTLKRQCRRILFLRQAQVTSLELTTYGVSGTARNRIDLLSAAQAEDIRARLANHPYIVLPVAEFMRFSTAQVSEDVLSEGQLVDLAITRVKTQMERERLGEKDSDPQTIRTTWRLQAQDMPFATIRFPVLVGIAQTKGPTFGQDAVFTVGPAAAMSFRKASLSWPGKYLSVEPYLHVARRIGDSIKRADGTDEVPATLWGAGVNVNLSGYVSFGLSYLGDYRFTRPGVFFMLEPAPWLSKALGLEKKLE